MRLITPREGWEVAILPTTEEAIAFALEQWLGLAEYNINEQESFSVALSGGSTPKAIYNHFTPDQLDWESVFLFWSDERAVPPEHERSNYRMVMESQLGKVGIPEENIFRMEAESDLEVHAKAYEHCIKEETAGVFDLVMLGLGEDGHTASLFPDTQGLKAKGLVTPNYVPSEDEWRMSLTFNAINKADSVVIYVLGSHKEEILREVFSGNDDYPIHKVEDAFWITDVQL